MVHFYKFKTMRCCFSSIILLNSILFLACNTLNNRIDAGLLNCGEDFQGGEYLIVNAPDGRRLSRSELQILSIDSESKTYGNVSSKGCVSRPVSGKFLVRSQQYDWASVLDSATNLKNDILILKDTGGDNVSVVCEEGSPVSVNYQVSIKSLLNESIDLSLREAYRLRVELIKEGHSTGIKKELSLLDLDGKAKLFNVLNEEGQYSVKLQVRNLTKDREYPVRTCSLRLDNTAPVVEFSVNQALTYEKISQHGVDSIAVVNQADSVGFVSRDSDVKEIIYCLEEMNDDFNTENVSARKAWQEKANSRLCVEGQENRAEPNKSIANEKRSGFWAIRFKAIDQLGNVSITNKQVFLFLNRDAIEFARNITSVKVSAAVSGDRSLDAANAALDGYALRKQMKTRYERDLTNNQILSGLIKVRNQNGIGLSLKGHSSTVTAVVFNNDGRSLITAGSDKTIKFWSTSSGRIEKTINIEQGFVTSLLIDPKANVLYAGATNDKIRRWNLSDGRELPDLVGQSSAVYALALSADGTKLASIGANSEIKIWDKEKNVILNSITLPNSMQGSYDFFALSFSPDSSKLASLSADRILSLWDVNTAAPIKTFTNERYLPSPALVFSKDGLKLISGSASGLVFWDIESGSAKSDTIGNSEGVSSFDMSRDGNIIVSTGKAEIAFDAIEPNVLRDFNSWPVKSIYPFPTKIAMSPGNRMIAFAPGIVADPIQMWILQEESNPETMKSLTDYYASISFSEDSKRIISVNYSKEIVEWDVGTRKISRFIPAEEQVYKSIAQTNNGKYLVGNRADGEIDILEYPSKKKILSIHSGMDEYSIVKLSPDDKSIVMMNQDRVLIWDLGSGTLIKDFKNLGSRAVSLVWGHDLQTLYVGGGNGIINAWNLKSQEKLGSFDGHTESVLALTLSSDGKYLISASRDKSIKIWDVSNGKLLRTLEGHSEWVQTLSLSPDNKILASAGKDGHMKLWSWNDGEEIFDVRKRGTNAIQKLLFSPDGKTLLAQEEAGTVKLYDVDIDDLASKLCLAMSGLHSGQGCSKSQTQDEE